jgi:hypothetical protein
VKVGVGLGRQQLTAPDPGAAATSGQKNHTSSHEARTNSFFEKRKLRKQLMEQRAEYPELNLHQQAPICSIKCFYWGDCDYQNGGHPCSVRHLEPIFKQ